ncbi:leishmanolysin-like peptidase isoform X2 [Halichondria panicea]|uniref:leishmanolysin-like peptidase isoform X2 n=1 Tax=Halichondria panicea TaxID=6063 RepID=UPI00312BB513
MGWLAWFAVLSALYITTEGTRLLDPEEMGTCFHEPGKITAKVHQRGSSVGARDKRQRTYEPIRILFYYDTTIDTMLNPTQRSRLQDVAIPAMEKILESSFSVIRATSPILLERECDEQSFYKPVEDPRQCIGQCAETPVCGDHPSIRIPENHLKRCVECNNGSVSNCTTRPGSVDGPGVPDTDLIIYVSAFDCSSFGSSVVAFASACQMESELDRPIAGRINFCPGNYEEFNDNSLIRIGLHEVIHAMVFSSELYPWFRDENGNPRTERDEFGFPPDEAGNTTLQIETYTDWSTRNGLVEHNVTLLITPNAVEQARIHYNCPDIRGVELENQGGSLSALSHWEQRVLGNELMTALVLFGSPFSRITFGLMEDSGWYVPNYEMAEPLAWGLNTGCTIPHGSCREYIDQQQASGRSISPYCDQLPSERTRGCTVDHQHLSYCTLSRNARPSPEYQYFEDEVLGSYITSGDYCPFNDESRSCSDVFRNSINNGGQLYGTSSRCFQLGTDWNRTSDFDTREYTPDAGCYLYNCTSTGVEIILEGVSIPCSCEGEEVVVDANIGSIRYQGSYICPSCASVCYDDLASCPSTEPAPCPGQVTNFTAGVPHPCRHSNPCAVNEVCFGFGEDGFTCEILGTCLAAGHNECCDSTSGNCTGSPPNCFCDPQCRIRGDCCSDIRDTCPSSCRAAGFDTCPSTCMAAGRNNCCDSLVCRGKFSGLDPCYCHPSCRRFGDCCDDMDIICPAQCGAFLRVDNGQVVVSGTDVGSTATYNCNDGYILNGNNSIRTCESIGRWSSPRPYCKEQLLELSCNLSSDGLSVECSSLLDGFVSLIYNCSLNNRSSTVCGPGPIFSLPMDGLGPGSYTYNITAFSPDGQRSTSVIAFAVPVNCDMEADTGSCFALIPRYFFNAKTGKCEMFTYGGCGGNNNNYKTLQECTQQCNPNNCPPYCTVEYCSARPTRTALCTLREPEGIMCDAKCRVTYCHTCYYDDEYRPLISSCKTCSGIENEFDKAKCFRRWAVCTRRADGEAYLKVRAREKTSEKFKCYEQPCA